MEDFNHSTGNKEGIKTMGQFEEYQVNDTEKKLPEICECNDLMIINGLTQNIHKYT